MGMKKKPYICSIIKFKTGSPGHSDTNIMRELEELTYSEVQVIHELIKAQLRVMEASCSRVKMRPEILSIEKKLANYLNAE